MTIDDQNTVDECLNCQATLTGPFCSHCGQARSERLVPLQQWIGEFLGTFLKLDSKFIRTLKRIMTQPGEATVDFGKGHRVQYCSPAKAYIIVSAFSIAAMTLLGVFSAQHAVPGMKMDASFQRNVQFLFPIMNLLSPFVTAGILAVLQRGFFFQLHLAFSLHFWTFLIAASTPLIFIPQTSVWALVAFALLTLGSGVYLYLAHRNVYAISILHRLVVCFVVFFSLPIVSLGIGAALYFVAGLLS